MKTIERALAEVEAGRLWRAKEILNGSLGNHPFSPELYKAYGDVLKRMGDLREAGKFLFLAGDDDENSFEAIKIFLNHQQAAEQKAFYATFPAKARLARLSDYPPLVAEELRRRGFQEEIMQSAPPLQSRPRKEKIKTGVFMTLGVMIFVLVVIGVIRGIINGINEVWRWFHG